MDKNFEIELEILDILEREFCISLRMADYTEGVILCAKNQALEKIKLILKKVSEEAERRGQENVKYLKGTVTVNEEKMFDEIASLKEQLVDAKDELDLKCKQNGVLIQEKEILNKLCADKHDLMNERTRERDEFKRAEKETSDAYLRIRELVGSWDTQKGGVDRFEVTENKIKDLIRERDEARKENEHIREITAPGAVEMMEETVNRKGFLRGVELAAKTCQELPIDKERCRVLLLTEQAWEEGQDSCTEAILKLKLAEDGKC